MRSKYWVAVVCFLLIACLTSPAFGQGFLPSWGGAGLFPFSKSLPKLDRLDLKPLRLGAAWMGSPTGLAISGNFTQSSEILSVDMSVPVKGLLLTASQGIDFAQGFGFNAKGSYLIPTNQDFSYQVLHNDPTYNDEHSLSSAVERWAIETTLYYEIFQNFSLIGGVKFDYHYILGSDGAPVILGGVLVTATGAEEMDITLTNIHPIFGFEYASGGPDSKLAVKFLGTPWTGTTAEVGLSIPVNDLGGNIYPRRWTFDHTPNSSYYLEGEIEYGRRLFGDTMVYGYFNTNLLHMSNFQSALELDGRLQQPGGSVLPSLFPADFSGRRVEYSIGGKVDVDFGSMLSRALGN